MSFSPDIDAEQFFASIDLSDLQGVSIVLITTLCALLAYVGYLLLKADLEAPIDYDVPVPEQCRDGWEGEVLDDPSLKVPGDTAIHCYAPATGESLGRINPSTADGIDRAVSRAAKAQGIWRTTTIAERRKMLKTLQKYILKNQDTIARAACLDSGKTRVDASFGEVLVTAEKISWTIKHGEKALKSEARPTNFLMMGKQNEVRYEPLGVVAACVSWNYPFHNLLGPCISSLFAGNAVIVKASEQTAWSSQFFISILQGALKACGHSSHLAQMVVCWPNVAPHLTSHPSISHLTFIGSRQVGQAVAASAAKVLTPVCMELGGKDAAIVLDDVGSDIQRIVPILMRGVFQAAGQNCVGIERIIALDGIYDTLVTCLATLVAKLKPGEDVGASISAANFDRLENLIADAVHNGARLIHGGKRFVYERYPKGHYFSPTLLVDVTPSMAIAHTELFAPVALIMRASSIDDAISLANNTPYALGSSIFGRNTMHLDRLAQEINAGMVAVNDFAVYYVVQLPFGGTKGSGYGRFAGEEGLRSVCNIKAVSTDHWWGMKTAIPGTLQYPIQGAKAERRAWLTASGVVKLGYGMTLWQRITGLRDIVGM